MSIPSNKMLPEEVWKTVLASVPIVCVDIIFINEKKEILYGMRKIKPYMNKWSLIGGRILRGESPKEAVKRQAIHYGLSYNELRLNDVFNANFGYRCDIIISFVARGVTGTPEPKEEFSRIEWKKDMPSNIGGIYKEEIRYCLDLV